MIRGENLMGNSLSVENILDALGISLIIDDFQLPFPMIWLPSIYIQ
jgi:hypothetical protein